MERAKRVPAKRSLILTNDILLQQHPRIRTKLACALGILINHRPKGGEPPLRSRDRQERASQRTASVRSASASSRLPSLSHPYRSVNATSSELNTGLNIYRMIDFEPV
jgi:hypothetical protein